VDLVFNLSPLKDANQTTQGVAIVLDDLTEKKRLEAQRALFERMVPPAVINQIDLNKIRLGGERATITTLFADVRGFTSFSESLPPEQLVSILNLYLAAAAETVMAQEGTLDKFMGDAVMAIFNAPIQQSDHTLRAVRAAIGIRDSLIRVHRKLPKQFWLNFGVGIHYGDAVLGLVGTEKRVDYTAIGDSVNTAKRIQENAVAGQILISKEAFERVSKNVKVNYVQPILAKGKTEPVEVYEVLNIV
jgi:class 3 adenylate cyclase